MPEPIRDDRELLREALGRTAECPPLEGLASAQPDADLQRHLEECPHCRAELALLRQFESAEAQPAEAADLAWIESELRQRSPAAPARSQSFADRLRDWFGFLFSPSGSGRLGMVAVALLVLVGVGIVLRPGSQTGQTDEPAVWRSGQFAVIAPIGDLDRAPSQLRWEPVTGAACYHVRLLEVDGSEIWSADTAATYVAFPNSIVAKFIAGRAFQWDATARDAAGKQISATSLQSFHILSTRR